MENERLLQQFQKHLKEGRIVQDNRIPYYIRWVRNFIRFCGDTAMSEQGEAFVNTLEKSGRNADWQIRQAHHAVSLFLQLMGNPVKSGDPPGPVRHSGKQQEQTWEQAIEEMHRIMRVKHYSIRTEQSYCDWVRRFAEYIEKTTPHLAGSSEVKNYLAHLALKKHVSASTQNQAFNGLLFFFRVVLKKELSDLGDTVRARQTRKLPVVLSREEIQRLFSAMGGTTRLMARLTYGTGLRLMECVHLRVQDIDFGQRLVIVRSGKGEKDRTTVLPEALVKELETHLEEVKKQHEEDLRKGYGEVTLPDAVARKYPNAGRQWPWQYVFPSATLSVDREDGTVRRFHMVESTLQKAVSAAAQQAGIPKRVSVHTLRHSFATHLLETGTSIRVIQELLGHKDVETTMIYTHVMRQHMWNVRSPLDDI